MIYRVFTESSQAPFYDLQGFYRVKPGPLFRFTGLLQSQARPPFSIYRVFTESSKAPFSIYRRFTANCFVEFLGFSSIFLHVVYMIF